MKNIKQKNKIRCISKATEDLRGSYAFGIIFDDEKDAIYATRKDSPLVIGVCEGSANFIASDISAILDFTINTYY